MIFATTILAVRRGDTVTMAGDGQVTIGDVVMKHSARKIRKLYRERVLAGFAGAVADVTCFDPTRVARYHEARIERLLKDEGIVRNRLKVAAAIDEQVLRHPSQRVREGLLRTVIGTLGAGALGDPDTFARKRVVELRLTCSGT